MPIILCSSFMYISPASTLTHVAPQILVRREAGGEGKVLPVIFPELLARDMFANSTVLLQSTLKAFREAKFDILVATDVAARGLDITGVELVIQVEPPKVLHSAHVLRPLLSAVKASLVLPGLPGMSTAAVRRYPGQLFCPSACALTPCSHTCAHKP